MGTPVFRARLADGAVERELVPGTYTVGRSAENAIALDDLSVSRRHARIVVEGETVFVEDLGSSGGTFVGGHRLPARTRQEVPDGESLRFGDVEAELSFAATAVAPPVEAEPVPAAAAVAAAVPAVPVLADGGVEEPRPSDEPPAVADESPALPEDALPASEDTPPALDEPAPEEVETVEEVTSSVPAPDEIETVEEVTSLVPAVDEPLPGTAAEDAAGPGNGHLSGNGTDGAASGMATLAWTFRRRPRSRVSRRSRWRLPSSTPPPRSSCRLPG